MLIRTLKFSAQVLAVIAVGLMGSAYTGEAKAAGSKIDAIKASFQVSSTLLSRLPADFTRYYGSGNNGFFDEGFWGEFGEGAVAAIYHTAPARAKVRRQIRADLNNEIFDPVFQNSDKLIRGGETGSFESMYGEGSVEVFTFVNQSCVAFIKPTGHSSGPPVDVMSGFYCAPVGESVTLREGIDLANASVKKAEGTEPMIMPTTKEQAASSSVRNVTVEMTWAGLFDNLKGALSFSDDGKGGKMALVIPKTDTTCAGTWSLEGGSFQSGLKPHGSWQMACSDGNAATGTFESNEPGIGQGSGKDAKEKAVAFTFGERTRT